MTSVKGNRHRLQLPLRRGRPRKGKRTQLQLRQREGKLPQVLLEYCCLLVTVYDALFIISFPYRKEASRREDKTSGYTWCYHNTNRSGRLPNRYTGGFRKARYSSTVGWGPLAGRLQVFWTQTSMYTSGCERLHMYALTHIHTCTSLRGRIKNGAHSRATRLHSQGRRVS